MVEEAELTGTIERGPRVDALLGAIDVALESLTALPEDGGEPWGEDVRAALLEDLRALRDGMAADPGAGGPLRVWAGLDELELGAVAGEEDDERLVALLEVDFCLSDLERAAAALAACGPCAADLATAVSGDDRASGFDDGVRDGLAAAVARIESRLRDGGYLTVDDVGGWFETLAAGGCTRKARGAFLERSSAGPSVLEGDVESYPKGRRWERAVLFDRVLVDVVRTDLETWLLGAHDEAAAVDDGDVAG